MSNWNPLHRFLYRHVSEWKIVLDRDHSEGKRGYYYHLTIYSLGWPARHEIVAKTPRTLLRRARADYRRFGKLWAKSERYCQKHGRWPIDDYLGRGNPTEEMAHRMAKRIRKREEASGGI